MFNWPYKRSKQRKLEDPVFGTLAFVKAEGPCPSHWEGRGHFDPVGATVTYFIEADESGPGTAHRAMYHRIAGKYPEILPAITHLLRRECAEISSDAIFTLDSLSIPALESASMEWSMDFSCNAGDDWLFTVRMKGWQPTGQIEIMH